MKNIIYPDKFQVKKKIIIVLVLFFTFYFLPFTNLIAQTTTENYVKSTEYLTENEESGNKKTTIIYYDGLGREKQSVQVGASPSGKDIIVHYENDRFGRQVKDYLPVPSNGSQGVFIPDPISQYNQYYGDSQTYNTQYYYFEKELENSPLNRVLKQAAPGNSWRIEGGHEIQFSYQTNTSGEVRLFKVNLTTGYEPTLSESGYYSAGQLYKAVVKNENWIASDAKNNTSEEFKNKEGRVVLKRTYNNGVAHDTYYVYDIYNNLTYVFPPILSDKPLITQVLLDDLGYQYKYDYRNRLVEKKLPGKGWEYLVYDKQDRLVAIQDALQRGKNQWSFIKYDKFSRVVYTGYINNTSSRSSLQTNANSRGGNNETRSTSGFTAGGIKVYYDNSIAIPNTIAEVLTINYYDSYQNTEAPTVTSIEGQTTLGLADIGLKGLLATSYAKILDGNTIGKGNWTYTYYDKKARPVRVYIKNHLGGFTQTDTKLDYFRGRTEYTLTKHSRATQNAEVTIREEFTYDSQERLLTHTHQTNGGNIEYLTQNVYDELGRLKNKKTGGQTTAGLQQVDYKYNIRGWLTDINDINNLTQLGQPRDLFAFKISYDQAETTPSLYTPWQYNGNISETHWRTDSDNIKRTYTYRYDPLNRLTDAYYFKNFNKNTQTFQLGYTQDEKLTYDKNGNITTLLRTGGQDISNNGIHIDLLSYKYKQNSNQLLEVKDDSNHPSGFNDGNKTGNDYAYDSNGNMTQDLNKNITTITYNHLNLPVKITFGDGNYIEYLYDASGAKMKKTIKEDQKIATCLTRYEYYLDGFQYHHCPSRGNPDPVLKFFPNTEGYVRYTSNHLLGLPDEFSYIYNYTDHLGNIRLSYTENKETGNLDILEENHYYPFGLKHEGYANNSQSNTNYKYKYQGQELQDELGLNWYSFKWRNYMPDIGRFFNVDPLTEEYIDWAPYTFSGNRVIDSRELEGLEPHSIHKTLDNAAINYGQQYNGTSITNDRETGTRFYSKTINGETVYSYTIPTWGIAGFVDPKNSESIPEGTTQVADGHTHGTDENVIIDNWNQTNRFSIADLNVANNNSKENPNYEATYVVTPNGSLLKYTPNDEKTIEVKEGSKVIPSDPNSSTRKNDIDPKEPEILPIEGGLIL